MICQSLKHLFPPDMLNHGNRMDELNVRPDCQLSDRSLAQLRFGKEAFLLSLMGAAVALSSEQARLGFNEELCDFTSQRD